MSGRWSLLAVLFVTGCHGLPHKHGKFVCDADPCPPACTDDAAGVGQMGPSGGGTPRVGAACQPCTKPQVEINQAPPDVQVNVPRQRIVLPRRPGCGAPAGPASPAGFSSPAGVAGRPGTVTEQQQMVQTRQVILMPQQVLVPFVQTTVSGPIRVTETQETSFLNVTNTATTGAAFVATGQIAALPGAAAANAAGVAASAQNMTECLTQLRLYEQRIAQLVAQTEALAAQVERLKGVPPGPPPK